MKLILYLLVLILTGCNASEQKDTSAKNEVVKAEDTIVEKKEPSQSIEKEKGETQNEKSSVSKTYSNERFKEVTIKKIGEHKFLVKGKGQIFEANFSWVVEDGHDELKKGYQMTDAGAPEWGNFSFTIDVVKKRPNSTLHLILFESSPKDGSRQYELPLLLY